MSQTREELITCYCDNTIPLTVENEIDLDAQPGIRDQIIEGDFLKVVCDRCGKELKPEFKLRLSSAAQAVDLLFLPELMREQFYKGEIDSEGAADLVIGYSELREFFLMRSFGLDRFPLEAVKLNLLQRAPSSETVEIVLAGREDDKLLFHILGLREEEVGLVRIPMKVYKGFREQEEKLRGEEEYAALIRGPYLSVNLVSFEEESE